MFPITPSLTGLSQSCSDRRWLCCGAPSHILGHLLVRLPPKESRSPRSWNEPWWHDASGQQPIATRDGRSKPQVQHRSRRVNELITYEQPTIRISRSLLRACVDSSPGPLSILTIYPRAYCRLLRMGVHDNCLHCYPSPFFCSLSPSSLLLQSIFSPQCGPFLPTTARG